MEQALTTTTAKGQIRVSYRGIVITRKTNRVYSHIVVGYPERVTPEAIARQLAYRRRIFALNFASFQGRATADAALRPLDGETKEQYVERHIAAFDAEWAKEREAREVTGYYDTPVAINWCGRLDLAQKALKAGSPGYCNVHIVKL